MYYNQLSQWEGIPMPLLMGFTQPAPIQEAEVEEPIIYNPDYQIVYDMRMVGTKSLRNGNPKTHFATDQKNVIDDQKYVK